jgi:lipoate-protein ligase A
MAIDEAILTATASRQAPNTLRLYQWVPSAVSIGKFQKLENEVSIENCRRLNVTIVRRISGGGAVYHDSAGEVTFNVVARSNDLDVSDVAYGYERIYSGIRDALRILGVSATFDEGNIRNCPNLTVGGKKISGSAQARKRGVILQHGTLLLDVDLERMFAILRVPWARTSAEVIEVARNRITSISKELGHKVSGETAANALATGFKNALNIDLRSGELTAFETGLAKRLRKERYATYQWNLYGKT